MAERRGSASSQGASAAAARGGCASVSESLAAAARGERGLGPAEQEHLSGCLRCRAEQLRYRRLMEAMRALRENPVGENPRMESQILGLLDTQGGRFTRRAPAPAAATLGGMAAGAAAAVGLIALAARHRRGAALSP